MINFIEMTEKNAVGMVVNGLIEKQDIEQAYKEINKAMSGGARIKMYAEAGDMNLSDISADALKKDLQLFFKNPSILPNIEKVALVTDSKLLKTGFELERALIPTMEGKTFPLEKRGEAKKWLAADQRAKSRMDITLAELAENNLLKTAGGFALGMLTAGVLSATQRSKVGKMVLIGAVAAGIPLGIKVLNNNRNLLCDK